MSYFEDRVHVKMTNMESKVRTYHGTHSESEASEEGLIMYSC